MFNDYEFTTIEYRGYMMDYNFLHRKEWSVLYCGDLLVFATDVEAQEFIDQILEEEGEFEW